MRPLLSLIENPQRENLTLNEIHSSHLTLWIKPWWSWLMMQELVQLGRDLVGLGRCPSTVTVAAASELETLRRVDEIRVTDVRVAVHQLLPIAFTSASGNQ